MKSWDRHQIVNLLLAAGRIAMRHYDTPRREVKDDGSLVTQADHEIEAFFAQHFSDSEQGVYLVGEETVAEHDEAYLREALAQTMYVVDPIDGTACYAHHVPIWGISIGFAQGGVLTEGAIYLPVLGELFISDGDQVYWTEDVTSPAPYWEQLEVAPKPFKPTGLVAITQKLSKRGVVDLGNPIHALACAVVPLAYLPLHRYTAYIGHLKLWDVAGGLPLLLKTGYSATLLDGTQLDGRITPDLYNLDAASRRRWKLRQPCLFAAPGTAEQLLPKLQVSGASTPSSTS